MSEQAHEAAPAVPVAEAPPAESGSLLNEVAAPEAVAPVPGEWLLTPDVKGTGDAPDWFKVDKYKSVQDQAEAYNALESKFGSFTGAPESYELNVPEGFEGGFDSDDPLLVAGMEFAKDSNMSQEGFDKMVALWISGTTDDPAAMEAARTAEISEVLGENSQQRINQVSGALANMLDSDTFAEIKPMVNTPQAVRLAEAIILAAAPKVSPVDGGNNPEGLSMAKWNEMREQRMPEGGPKAGELRFHVDADFRKEAEVYLQRLNGEG